MVHDGEISSELDVFLKPESWRMIGADMDCSFVASGVAPARKEWSGRNSHCHPEMETVFCIKGESVFSMGGSFYACKPGTIFTVRPNVEHDLMYPPGPPVLEHIWIMVLGLKVLVAWYRIENGVLRRIHEGISVFSEKELGVSASLLANDPEDLPQGFFAPRVRLFVGAVALKLAEWRLQLHAKDSSEPLDNTRLQQEVVSAICQHIDTTAGREVTLDFLAHYSGYSKFHLLRIFKQHAGCTIHEYINRVRVRRMSKMQERGKTNKCIADELGFSSPNSYLRWRRQILSVTDV